MVVFFVAGPGVEGVVGFAPPARARTDPGGWGEENDDPVHDKPCGRNKSQKSNYPGIGL